MRGLFVWSFASFAGWLASGCGNVQTTAPDAPGNPTIALRVTSPLPAVPIGGMNAITVAVDRGGGFGGPVAIAGAMTPTGLTVTPASIAASETSVDVLVTGAPPLAVGGVVSFALEGTADGVDPARVTIDNAAITGRPGSLDDGFGAGGGLTSANLGGDDNGGFIAMDVINGKVVGVGYGVGGLGATRMIAMRFNADGMIDSTWNGGALVRTSFGTTTGDTAVAVATGQQNDGRSVAIGDHTPGGADIAVVRYSLTGGPGGVDFGDGTGKGLVNLGGTEKVTDGLVLPTNQIIAVGELDGHFMVSRMTSGGLIDTTFASVGFTRTILGSSSTATGVALDSQDRVIVVGSFVNSGGDSDLVVRRLTAAGALDGAFGPAGVTFGGPDSETAIAVTTVGEVVVVASVAGTSAGTKLRVRRILATGEPDTTFGTAGVAETTLPSNAIGRDMVVVPDGRVIVLTDVTGIAVVTRFTASGTLDDRFGTTSDGTARVDIGMFGEPRSLAVYDDHRILVGGGNQGGSPGPGTFAIVGRMWM